MRDALKRSLAFLLAFGMAFTMSFSALAEGDAETAEESVPVIVEEATETKAEEPASVPEVTSVVEEAAPAAVEEAPVAEETPAAEAEEPVKPADEEPSAEAEKPAVEEETAEEAPAEETETIVEEVVEVIEEEVVEEEPVAEEGEASEEEEVETETSELAGDANLLAGVTTKLAVPAGTGPNAKGYANFSMGQGGLLTITFKSVGIGHGNLELDVYSANYDDIKLWGLNWTTASGTVNFSAFVDAGTYNIVISKTDPTDEAPYEIEITPLVSREGEAGTRNNALNDAPTLNADGTTYYGIVSLQDCMLNHTDYYKFVLSSPGWLAFDFTNLTMSDVAYIVSGQDAWARNIAFWGDTVGPCADLDERVAQSAHEADWYDAGVYYVIVKSQFSSTDVRENQGRYQMKLTLTPQALTEIENNNTIDEADSVGNVLDTVNGVSKKGMLGIASTPWAMNHADYYEFVLPMTQVVDFSVAFEMADIKADIYGRDKAIAVDALGAAVATWGGSAVSPAGTAGNPYMLEKKGVRLEAGTYFVRIGTTSNGNTGLYTVKAQSKITASDLEVKSGDGIITAKGVASGGPRTALKHVYRLYFKDPGTGVVSQVDEQIFDEKNGTAQFSPGVSGEYYVTYSVTDGVDEDTWKNKTYPDGFWKVDFTAVPFKIVAVEATDDGNGLLTLHAIYTGGAKLEDSYYTISFQGQEIFNGSLEGGTDMKFQCPATGSYHIKFSGYMPGHTPAWQAGECDITVDVDETTPLKVTSLALKAGVTTIDAVATVSGGTGLTSTQFLLKDAGTGLTLATFPATGTSKALSHTFTGLTPGKAYAVVFIAKDAHTTATYVDELTSQAPTVTTLISTTLANTIAVSNVKLKGDNLGNVTMSADIQNAMPLTWGQFYLYFSKDGTNWDVLTILNSTTGSASTKVYQSGQYEVQYVCGNAYNPGAGAWSSIVPITLKAKVDGITLDISGSFSNPKLALIDVICKMTSAHELKSVNYYLYDDTDDPTHSYVVDYFESKNVAEHVFYVTTGHTYTVEVIAKDTVSTAKDSKQFTTNPGSGSSTAFSVTSVSATKIEGQKVTLDAVTNDARKLIDAYFIIYNDASKVVATLDGKARNTTIALKNGTYSVQFTATDGATWANAWGSFTVGSSTPSTPSGGTNSVTGPDANGIYTVTINSSITDTDMIWVRYTVYDKSKNIAYTWQWPGSGQYTSHTFDVTSNYSDIKGGSCSIEAYNGTVWRACEWITIN